MTSLVVATVPGGRMPKTQATTSLKQTQDKHLDKYKKDESNWLSRIEIYPFALTQGLPIFATFCRKKFRKSWHD